jgi:hypothetical protein
MQQRDLAESQQSSAWEGDNALKPLMERRAKNPPAYDSHPVAYYPGESSNRSGQQSNSERNYWGIVEDCNDEDERVHGAYQQYMSGSKNSARKQKSSIKSPGRHRQVASELQFSPTQENPKTYSDLFQHQHELDQFNLQREKAWGFTGSEVYAEAKGGRDKGLKIETEQPKPKKKMVPKGSGVKTTKAKTQSDLMGNSTGTPNVVGKKKSTAGVLRK